VVMKPPIFWDVTPCSPLEAWKALPATFFMLDLVYSSTLKMEATCSSEILVDFPYIVMCISDYRRGFELANGFSSYTFKITVIITYKSSLLYLLALAVTR
jgi:hypothetical protein